MKYTTISTMAALLLGAASLQGQTSAFTKPAGFVTHTLKAGQFNLIGLTLHESVTVAGAFETVSGTTLTDNEVNFGTALTAGTTYVLEVISGTLTGTVQEVTTWSGNTITTPDDLAAEGLAVGDKYQIRAAASLQQVLGDPAVIGASFAESGADVVWVPDGTGGYTRYFYQPAPLNRWFNATANTAVTDDIPLVYTDGFFVQVKSATDIDLVVTGSVKVEQVDVAVFSGFNLISGVYPVGSNLENSGLKDSLTASFAEAGADVVWLPTGDGSYERYFYQPAPLDRWFNATDNVAATASTVVLPSAFFIQRKGASKNVEIDPPSSYSGL